MHTRKTSSINVCSRVLKVSAGLVGPADGRIERLAYICCQVASSKHVAKLHHQSRMQPLKGIYLTIDHCSLINLMSEQKIILQ